MLPELTFISSFFKKLEEEEIAYAILRNAKDIVNGDGHDIDLTVDFKKWDKIESIIKRLSREQGWKVHFKALKDCNNLYAIHLFHIEDGIPQIIHFDFFRAFGWNGYQLIPYSKLLLERKKEYGVYVASNAVQAVTMLFSRFLYQGYIKEQYKKQIQTTFQAEAMQVKWLMTEFLTHEFVENIFEDVLNSDWDNIEQEQYVIRRNIVAKLSGNQKFVSLKMKLFMARRMSHKTGAIISVAENVSIGCVRELVKEVQKLLSRTFAEEDTRILMGGYADTLKNKLKYRILLAKGNLIAIRSSNNKGNVAIDCENIKPEDVACSILDTMSRRYE